MKTTEWGTPQCNPRNSKLLFLNSKFPFSTVHTDFNHVEYPLSELTQISFCCNSETMTYTIPLLPIIDGQPSTLQLLNDYANFTLVLRFGRYYIRLRLWRHIYWGRIKINFNQVAKSAVSLPVTVIRCIYIPLQWKWILYLEVLCCRIIRIMVLKGVWPSGGVVSPWLDRLSQDLAYLEMALVSIK